MSVAFIISFVAIIFSGPLDIFLSEGIAFALVGTIPMALIGSFYCSYKGTILQPQDISPILISGAAVAIAGDWTATNQSDLFSTILTLIAVTTLFSGIVAYLFGRFKLGYVARYVPYPVVGGFLVATGYFLTTGGLSVITGETISIWNLMVLTEPDQTYKWIPWLCASMAAVAVTRLSDHEMALPLVLIVSAAGFYAALGLFGIDFEAAADLGLLISVTEDADFLSELHYNFPLRADWSEIVRQFPSIVAIAGMAILGLLMNASGIEVTTGEEIDFERDLKAVGAANISSGILGGMVGYHLLAETIFANKTGLTGRLAGICVACASMFVLIFGASAISIVPTGLIGSIITFLGLDLLYTWLVEERRRLSKIDFATVLLILIVAATVGYLEALTIGLLAATVLFILTYSKIGVIRMRSTAATRRSTVERRQADLAYLSEAGKKTAIFELGGFLFFGTAHSLLETLRSEFLQSIRPDPILIDFSRVTGLDSSAAVALAKFADECSRKNILLILSGLSESHKAQLFSVVTERSGIRLFPRLNDALVSLEKELLDQRQQAKDGPQENIIMRIAREYPELEEAGLFTRLHLEPGEVLMLQGDNKNAMYELISGELRAEIMDADGKRVVIAHFLQGALVGEIAFYAGIPRSADVLADTEAEVMMIELDRLPDTPEAQEIAIEFHREAAKHLALRLARMNQLVRDMRY